MSHLSNGKQNNISELKKKVLADEICDLEEVKLAGKRTLPEGKITSRKI